MDSRLIEVAIGLALMFALVSLLATAVMEGIASIRNHRGKILQQLILSVMGDDDALKEKFYGHVLIRSMYKDNRRPAYVPSDIFVTTLLSMVSENLAVKPRTGTPIDFLEAVRASPLGKRPQSKTLLDTLDVLVQGVQTDWPRFEATIRTWFDQAGERSAGWYKRGNTMWLFGIGAVLAVGLNLDSVRVATALWRDPVLRAKTMSQAQIALEQYEKDKAVEKKEKGKQALQPVQSPATEAPAKAATPPAFPTPAATGAPAAKPAGGAGATVVGPGPITPLTPTPSAKGTITKAPAASPVDAPGSKPAPAAPDALKLAQDAASQLEASINTSGSASTAALSAAMWNLFALNDAILANSQSVPVAKTPEEDRRQQPATAPTCTDENLSDFCEATTYLKRLQDTGLPMGWGGEFPTRHFGVGLKTVPWELNIGNFLVMVAGWLVTAIAVTLGAPFWFDTLSKLVKLRGSGDRSGTEASKAGGGGAPAAAPATGGGSEGRVADGDGLTDDERKLTASEIEVIQQRLGVPNNQVTGRLDTNTRGFIGAWQERTGIKRTSLLTAQQIGMLLSQGPSRAAPAAASQDEFLG